MEDMGQHASIFLQNTGVNLGSSRGATHLFETFHEKFLTNGSVPGRTSPSTTLGNISSWIAQDLGTSGAVISHSITCSTALHGVLNAIAWLQSGMASSFIVGGAEAPLTAFTIAQLEALKLYSSETEHKACRSLDFQKKTNSLVLGEAAAVFLLSSEANNAKAKITGIGYANEQIKHSISISTDARCFQQSMKMALKHAGLNSVDAIVMHAPGTVKGDIAELKAIEKTFSKTPFLTTNKWKIGHTYGASGGMSLEMAIFMLRHQTYISNPFYTNLPRLSKPQHIMINAVGFGGNAVSIIIGKS
jgi:3-oxoacyl-(acyl-carrier-protein) synthase